MKNLFTVLFALGACISVLGQSPDSQREITLTGIVQDKDDGFPLEYATVSLVSTTDPSNITGGITDQKGAFAINAPAGVYDIKIEFISFAPDIRKAQRLFKDTNLGVVQLAIDAATLENVMVVAEKTTVEFKLDKQVYNVGKDLTVRGGTVSDVLDNVPSVSVDVEGNVALRGNDDIRILINGKPSGLVGLNSSDALRQLPAESIERVEVITSPSARYDAEGSAGIINIILRRSKLQGLNGAVTANAGYPETYGLSGNVNYRTGDFNFFTTAAYNNRGSLGNSFTRSLFPDGNTVTETRTFDRQRRGLTGNFGLEYYIDDNTSITGSVVVRDSDNDNLSENTIVQTGTVNSTSFRISPEEETDNTLQYSLNFDKRWENDGNLSIELQLEDSSEDEFTNIRNIGLETQRETIQTLEDQNRFLAQLDFVQPIGENHRFEAGYRGNFNELNTDYTVTEDFDNDGVFEVNTDLTNNLIYTENVNALYTQWGSKINKFNYLLGLRMEHTAIEVDQRTNNTFNNRDFTNFFPTVNLNYELTEKQTVSLGYNRRIRRARNRFINPFPSRTSQTVLFQGNPNINPSISNGLDLGYLNRLGKVTLSGSVYFRRSEDVFQFITRLTGEQVEVNGVLIDEQVRTPINLAQNDRYGGEITMTYSPSSKWRMNVNANLFRSETSGFFEGTDFGNENTSWTLRLNNKYTLPTKIDWQTRLNYRGPTENAQSTTEGIFTASLAFSKDLFNENASIAFNVNDVFNSRKRRSDIFEPVIGESEFQWRERSFNLSFTYRFNQKKKRQREGYQGGGDDDFEG
ncbi:MAG: TonB-dependent receptor [Cytophagaceae bacterium]|nr:TonB-dependent receptor [Cytophagaceae bacterium]